MISLIVAIAQNNAIGKDNDLLWHLSEDLKYFKKTTNERMVLMGRKTWESLPFKPLKNRRNIVVSSQKDYAIDGAELFESVDKVFESLQSESDEVFCIGGASLYKALLPKADKLYITRVYKDFEADVFFPEIDENIWEVKRLSPMLYEAKADLKFRFEVWERKNS
ncbi:MAG: dihydrofolate reductase [Bacteroidales bacterium]|nr:dihydrofolate reductase [Bacteroidales bacterium]